MGRMGARARDARGQRQLLVELIAADLGQVVSLGVEEQAVDQGIGRLHRCLLYTSDAADEL